ncbi:alpha/beta hydrolase [Intrasporangium sp.]|uniref:alpha/beta hydrolase n=1 Tax=Intrasporangium sp. TaxID=1925024 RepID=UPI002939FB2B|nr:alpha/beta hydrolase [Intrasporangium sp.]MDV3222581.1 alpha/beta hydrolase [Intrasporangium sp.]
MPLASLTWDARPARAGAIALVMHGGSVEGREPNHAWSHNVARLVPFARGLRKVPGPLAVARLRFRYRGWNGAEASPVEDARWALAQLRAAYPGAPIGLVGHSMGGRTALAVTDDEDVRLVVGLAPWIERGDPVPRDGQKTVLIHGDRDRITALARSRRTVDLLRADGRDATLIRIARGDHAMLVRAGLWTTLVVDIVGATFAAELGGRAHPRPGPIGAVVTQAVHGGGGIVDI